MNIWSTGVITNQGLELQAKLIEGTILNITRAVTGSGYVDPSILKQLTAVVNEQQTLEFLTVTYPEEGKCKLPCYLNNDTLGSGYTAMQVGIYAIDPDGGEILYFIAQAEEGTGTIVPSSREMPGYKAEWDFYFQYGQADAVNVIVDPSDVATTLMLEDKADRDMGNVPNVQFLQKAVISGAAIPIVTTEGDGTNYQATVPGMDELKVGMSFIMIPHETSNTTMPKLDVNGLGPLPLRQQLSANFGATTAGAITTWVSKGKPALVTYDGSLWKVNIARTPGAYLYGSVPVEKGGTGAETQEEARLNLGAASDEDVNELETKISMVEDALFNDITGNEHSITFNTLDGLIVTGIWNKAKARLEC